MEIIKEGSGEEASVSQRAGSIQVGKEAEGCPG